VHPELRYLSKMDKPEIVKQIANVLQMVHDEKLEVCYSPFLFDSALADDEEVSFEICYKQCTDLKKKMQGMASRSFK